MRRALEITNIAVRALPPSLNREDPSHARHIHRPRQLRRSRQSRPPYSNQPVSKRLHTADDANKMRWKRILRTGLSTLTIQPTSVEDAAFLDGLIGDAEKCLSYSEWLQRYKAAIADCVVHENGEWDEFVKRDLRHLFDNVSLRCHLEAMAPLLQEHTVPDRWHVPASMSVLARPMTRRHLALVLSFKWNGVFNPMQLRHCLGWQGECLVVNLHGPRPFELPPYRLLNDCLEMTDVPRLDTRWHWGQPMCLVCRTQSLHFPLLTREGRDIKAADFSMYHDYDYVDLKPEYVMRIPRPCRETESGVYIETQTLAVLAFTKALVPTEDGYDVSAVCK